MIGGSERESMRRRMWIELEEAFDHRYDGLAANRRFEGQLRIWAIMWAGGSVAHALSDLAKAERAILKARGVKSGDMPVTRVKVTNP